MGSNPGVGEKRASGKYLNGFEDADKSQLSMPESTALIALHSPASLGETGLSICPPEKSHFIDRVHWWAVRSLQSGL